MTYKVKLSRKNQITIPVEALRALDTEAGDIIHMSVQNGRFIMEPLEQSKLKVLAQLHSTPPKATGRKETKPKSAYGERAVSRYTKSLK